MTSADAPKAQVFWSFYRQWQSSVPYFHVLSLWFSAVISDPVRPIESQQLRPLFLTLVSLILTQNKSFCTFSSATCSNIWLFYFFFLLRSNSHINKVGGNQFSECWVEVNITVSGHTVSHTQWKWGLWSMKAPETEQQIGQGENEWSRKNEQSHVKSCCFCSPLKCNWSSSKITSTFSPGIKVQE